MPLDDRPLGQVLSRRQVLALLGAGRVSLLTGASPAWAQGAHGSAGCVVRPAQTEGPYFVDERLQRSDLRTDPTDGSVRLGIPLELTLVISRLAGTACAPLAGAQVDVWHGDHLGVYADVTDPRFTTTGTPCLRGSQLTDAQGQARFTTIDPGGYEGRTVHIHVKVRSPAGPRPGDEFTSQLYVDDGLTDRVSQQPPYAGRTPRTTRHSTDGIDRHGGAQLRLALAPQGAPYQGTFQVALTGV
jgi:protocatechuate 3,4-dioxygenase beta subunit